MRDISELDLEQVVKDYSASWEALRMEASEHEDDVPGMPESQDTVIDGEFTEISETEDDIRAPEEPMTELQIAQDELERAKNLLKAGLECGVDENDIYIRRLKLKVCALASYVCDLDDIVNPPPRPEQPELPVLKNNDQRAASWMHMRRGRYGLRRNRPGNGTIGMTWRTAPAWWSRCITQGYSMDMRQEAMRPNIMMVTAGMSTICCGMGSYSGIVRRTGDY